MSYQPENIKSFTTSVGDTAHKGGGSKSKESRLKHWWTQSDVFYATRKLLIENHYANEEIDRDYITGLIKQVCEDELHVKREDIGILAADRAQLYFKGKWMDVGLKDIEELSLYGVDMLIIEKEGIAEQWEYLQIRKGLHYLTQEDFWWNMQTFYPENPRKKVVTLPY